MAGGWIKIHSKILDWRWYHDDNTFRVFFHLILTASYKDKPWRNIIIKRGQRVASATTLGEELQLSRMSVRTALNHLISTNEITSQATSQYTIYTVVNYDKYQAVDRRDIEEDDEDLTNQATNDLTNKQPTTNQRLTTSKEYKEDKNIKKGITTPISPKVKIPKIKYSQHVHMTEEEYQKLVDEVGLAGAARCVQLLDAYKESKGKYYASDYGAMRTWVIGRYFKDLAEAQAAEKKKAAAESERERKARLLAEAFEWAKEEDAKRGIGSTEDDADLADNQLSIPK